MDDRYNMALLTVIVLLIPLAAKVVLRWWHGAKGSHGSPHVVRCAVLGPQSDVSTHHRSTKFPPGKRAVASAYVHVHGVHGDYNHYRFGSMHATDDRAVSLMTVDALQSINAAGLGVAAGELGENFTLAGVEYDNLRVGHRLALGDEAVVEITEEIIPCPNLMNMPCMAGRGGNVATQRKFLYDAVADRRGKYARVVVPGTVRSGDVVRIVPDGRTWWRRADPDEIRPLLGLHVHVWVLDHFIWQEQEVEAWRPARVVERRPTERATNAVVVRFECNFFKRMPWPRSIELTLGPDGPPHDLQRVAPEDLLTAEQNPGCGGPFPKAGAALAKDQLWFVCNRLKQDGI